MKPSGRILLRIFPALALAILCVPLVAASPVVYDVNPGSGRLVNPACDASGEGGGPQGNAFFLPNSGCTVEYNIPPTLAAGSAVVTYFQTGVFGNVCGTFDGTTLSPSVPIPTVGTLFVPTGTPGCGLDSTPQTVVVPVVALFGKAWLTWRPFGDSRQNAYVTAVTFVAA